MRDNSILISGLKKFGIKISKQQEEQFEIYYDLLTEKNKVMNLTAITDYQEVLQKHFLDSAALFFVVEHKENAKLLDMGTGAGFPGIPLKIIYPDLQITLMDSLNKRVVFLNDVIEKLHLENITAIHARAEEMARKEGFREQFDYVVSRAVARTASLTELCLPYVKMNGYFLPYKSGKVEDELNEAKRAIQVMGGNLQEIKTFFIPDTTIERTIPIIKKISITPKCYPRAGGKPLKTPLI